MIRVFCLYKHSTKIPLFISRCTTVLLYGTDGTDLLFFRSVFLAVLIPATTSTKSNIQFNPFNSLLIMLESK